MRVFTQRLLLQLVNEYGTANPTNYWIVTKGANSTFDAFFEEFNSAHPGAFPSTVNPLDYCVILDPPAYLIGKYWGGEEALGVATEWVTARNDRPWAPTTLITCDDNQHPTELSVEEILSPESLAVLVGHLKTGHYLASDPDTFVSVA